MTGQLFSDVRRWRGARAISAAVVVTVVGASCSSHSHRSASATPADAGATATAERMTLPSPEATVAANHIAELLAPANPSDAWLALGSRTDLAAHRQVPVVWSAPNAATWAATDLPVPAGRSATINGAVRVGARVVAVGRARAAGDADGVAWVERAGTWRLADVGRSAAGAGDEWFDGVAAGPGGLVAWGTAVAATTRHPVLWTSTDGTGWQPVAGDTSHLPDGATVASVAVGPAGAVAVGSLPSGAGVRAAVWFSADRRTWTEARDDTAFPGVAGTNEALHGVVWDGQRFVAVGATEQQLRAVPQVWTSVNGKGWLRVAVTPPTQGTDVYDSIGKPMTSIVAAPGRLVSVGGTVDEPRVWDSADGGDTWRELDPPRVALGLSIYVNLSPGAVAATPDTVVIATTADDPPRLLRHTAIGWADVSATARFAPPGWSYTVNDLARTPAGWMAVGWRSRTTDVARTTEGVVWQSTDGHRWELVAAGGPAFVDAIPQAIAVLPDRVVLVGGEEEGPAAAHNQGQGQGLDGLAWVTTDGHTFERVRDQAGFGGPGHQQLWHATTAGGAAVVSGLDYHNDDIDMLAARTTDGHSWQRTGQAVLGGPGEQSISALCPLPAGGVLGVGWETAPGQVQRSALWRSDNGGTAWTRDSDAGGLQTSDPSYLLRCTGAGPATVAVGQHVDSTGARIRMLTTTDGHTWLPVSPRDAPFEQLPRLGVAAVTGDATRIALVVSTTAHGDSDIELWARNGTQRFVPVRPATTAGPGGQYANAAVIEGTDAVVAGVEDDAATMWRVRLP